MAETVKITSFTLLKDQPLQGLDSFDRSQFGHRDIARTLAQMVLQCPTPFTIGLFGKWGSGKSTIANMLSAELTSKSIPVVLFDVWKHEGDSLRRSFLKELVLQLRTTCLDQEFVLNDRLEHSVGRTNEGSLRFHKGKSIQLLAAVIVLIGLVVGGAAFASKFGLGEAYKTFLGIVFGSALVVWLLNVFTQVIGTETTTFSQEKLQDPHEFENEFADIIKAATASRLLIIFDNLDRVTHEKALEALTTIKTFLEPKDSSIPDRGIVFLIPCDDKAIRAHIRAVYGIDSHSTPGNRAFDPDEFLRKFFNTVLWIPDFISSELESYARSCLKTTGISDLDDEGIAWLVTKAFRDNPRQIIQFVNILVSNFVLIREREGEEKDFETGFAKKNRLEICLYLLLNHLYPNVMAELRSLKATSLEEHQLESLTSIGIDETAAKQFLAFVSEVKSEVTMTNLRTYYSLRRSDQEKQFPGIDRLFEVLEDNEIAKAKEQAQGMEQLGNNVEALSSAIKTHFENITNPTTKAYFLNGLFRVLDDKKITLNQSCYAQFNTTLISETFQERIDTISPRYLYSNMLSHHVQFQQPIVERWVGRLEAVASEEKLRKTKELFISEAFELFASVPELLGSCQGKVQGIVATHFASDLKTMRLFIGSQKTQVAVFSKPLVEGFIQSISERDLANLPKPDAAKKELAIPERWSMLLSLVMELMDSELFGLCIKKFTEVVVQRSPLPLSPEVERDRNIIFVTMRKLFDTFGSLSRKDMPLVPLVDAVISNANTLPDWSLRSRAIALLVRLYDKVEEAKRLEIANFITQFCTVASPEAIQLCSAELGGVQQLLTAGPYTSPLETRSIAEPALFDVFYGSLPDAKKTEWLLKVLTANPTEGLRRLKVLNYAVPNGETITKHLLSSVGGYAAPEKADSYEACNVVKCNGKPELVEQYAEQLLALLKSPEQAIQKIGLDAAIKADFFAEETRRSLVKGVFDWIETLPSASKYQSYALEYVLHAVDHLNRHEKEKLGDICIDELAVKSNNVSAVRLAFKILGKLHIPDTDLATNFMDVQQYYNSCTDDPLKVELRNGLKLIKPEHSGEKTKGFWDWFDSLEKPDDSNASPN